MTDILPATQTEQAAQSQQTEPAVQPMQEQSPGAVDTNPDPANKPSIPSPSQMSDTLPMNAVLVTEISRSVKRQEIIAKKTLLHSRIRTALLVVMVGVMIYAGFMAVGVIGSIQTLSNQATQTILKLDDTVESMHLKDTMAGIDTMVKEGTDLVADGSALITDSSKTLTTVLSEADEALKAISVIDFEALNVSIQKLSQITTAFGKVFGIK